jgi:hypothetical protein
LELEDSNSGEKALLGNCFLDRITRISGLRRFEFAHHEETAGHLSLCLFPLLHFFAVDDRGVANVFVKESAERSETLKSDFEADVGHAKLVAAEEFLGFFDTTLDQVLVRRLVESLSKKTQKVIARKARFLGNLIEAQRVVVAVVDKITRTAEPLERLKVFDSSNHQGFGGKGF